MCKKEREEALKILNDFESKIVKPILEKRSGESWWSPPGEDWFFSCDMGYVGEFLSQLRSYLEQNEAYYNYESTSPLQKNARLINPPIN